MGESDLRLPLFLQAAFLRSRFCYIRCNPISGYFVQSEMTRGRFHFVVRVIEHLDAPASSVLFIAQGCGAEKLKYFQLQSIPALWHAKRNKMILDRLPSSRRPLTLGVNREFLVG
jgi:hypothetical protein